jgi:hypothetical protein
MSFLKSNKYAGGIADLYLLPVIRFKGLGFNSSTGLFVPRGMKNFLSHIPFTIDTGRWRAQKKNGAWDIRVSCTIKGADHSILDFLEYWQKHPFIIVARDANSSWVVLGDYENYFLYSTEFDSGADFSEGATIAFQVSKNIIIPPRFVFNPFINTPPHARAVAINGFMQQGETITGVYSYIDYDEDVESNSLYKWQIADDANGLNLQDIAGETSQSLELNILMTMKYIRFGVTPYDGIDYGAQAFSQWQFVAEENSINKPPDALGVNILGVVKNGETVSGTYTYIDEEGDPEWGTAFAWYMAENASGLNRITLTETSQNLTLDASHSNKYLQFGVTPNNSNGTGVERLSDYKLVERKLEYNYGAFIVSMVYKATHITNAGVIEINIDETSDGTARPIFRVSNQLPTPILSGDTWLNFEFELRITHTTAHAGVYPWPIIIDGASRLQVTTSGREINFDSALEVGQWMIVTGRVRAASSVSGFNGVHIEPNPGGVLTQFSDWAGAKYEFKNFGMSYLV